MTKEGEFLQFTHSARFDVSKFHDYRFDERFEGPIFTTCHWGIQYKWRIYINPNGGKFRTKLENGEWSEWKADRTVRYQLKFFGGPVSSLNAFYSLEVKPSKKTSAVIHRNGYLKKSTLFDLKGVHSWGYAIAPKKELEKDGSLEGGFLTVIAEIKMSLDLFDPNHVVNRLKKEIGDEKIEPVPTSFFDSIDKEPSYGVSLKLVVGNVRENFHCIHQVLEKNSAYFRNLLNSSLDFKENRESKIEFFDLDPEGVRAALRYIYLKESPENFEKVAEVCLPAAHLFLLPGLVLECERVLIRNLTVENDVAMAVLAQTYDLTLLKNMATNSMAYRYDDVRENSKLLEKLEDKLLNELVKVVACHVRSVPGIIA